MLTVICWVLAGLLIARLVVGWTRQARWEPAGDPLLVAAMLQMKPPVRGRVACATVDLNPGAEHVRWAFNRCDADAIFEIGSVSKALTGLVMADAIERGEITSGTTLSETWPELTDSAAANITMDELAHHVSGLPRLSLGPTAVVRMLLYLYAGLDPYRGMRFRALLRLTGRVKLRNAGRQRYSNLGAALAGHALARHARTDYPSLMKERLFDPLGMASSSAAPDTPRQSGRSRYGLWVQPWRCDAYAPAGDVTSTLRDCTRLVEALLTRAAPGAPALEDGLFWQLITAQSGSRCFWHNGQTGGYSSYLAVYPDARRAVVVLAAVAEADRQARLAGACVNAAIDACS